MTTTFRKEPERRTWLMPIDFDVFFKELRDYLQDARLRHDAYGIKEIRIELPRTLNAAYREHRSELFDWIKRNAMPCKKVSVLHKREDILVELFFPRTHQR